MRKKIMAILLMATLALSLTACGKKEERDSESKKKTEESSDGDTLKADKKLLSVEVTLPASLVEDSEITLDEEAQNAGVKEIIKNDDGSVTMKMSKDAHKKLLDEIKTGINESIDEILSEKENYPSFESITYDDDVTTFTVSVDASAYGGFQSFAALALYIEGNYYQALNAVPEDQLKTIVNFVDRDTGEIIEGGDSSSFGDSSEE